MDALEGLKQLDKDKVNFILTDPPYPDYHAEKYNYKPELIEVLNQFKCKQLIFWSSKVNFPLNYTAIHIWDKLMGVGSEYERIFERNGGKQYKMFRGCPIQNKICAQMSKDIFTGHPSQKPIKLIKSLISKYTKEGDLVLDLYCGTGVVPLVCIQLKRRFIAFEINPEYCKIAEERIQKELSQSKLNSEGKFFSSQP